jgi:hypothetical protein
VRAATSVAGLAHEMSSTRRHQGIKVSLENPSLQSDFTVRSRSLTPACWLEAARGIVEPSSESGTVRPFPRLPKPESLCQRGPRCSVVWRDHRIIVRQIPFLTVLLGCHAKKTQMPPQRFEFPAVVKANQIVRHDRFADRYGGYLRFWLGSYDLRPGLNLAQSVMNGLNQIGEL